MATQEPGLSCHLIASSRAFPMQHAKARSSRLGDGMIEQPLVSLIIPTFRRAELLMDRSLPSAMGQTYSNLDIHVVGDGTDQETVDAMATVTDPRVRFTNITHQHYPEQNSFFAWCVSGTDAINYGLDTALGTWVST